MANPFQIRGYCPAQRNTGALFDQDLRCRSGARPTTPSPATPSCRLLRPSAKTPFPLLKRHGCSSFAEFRFLPRRDCREVESSCPRARFASRDIRDFSAVRATPRGDRGWKGNGGGEKNIFKSFSRLLSSGWFSFRRRCFDYLR